MDNREKLIANRKNILEKIKQNKEDEKVDDILSSNKIYLENEILHSDCKSDIKNKIEIDPIFSISSDLPIKQIESHILSMIETSDIILIHGATGTGKSTQIPKLLLTKYKNIICSQPRRIATVSVCKRVKYEIKNNIKKLSGKNKIKDRKDSFRIKKSDGSIDKKNKITKNPFILTEADNSSIKNNIYSYAEIENMISYKIRFYNTSTHQTRLLYVTDGILLQECMNDNIYNYDIIVVDEVHERNCNTDLFISYYRNYINKVENKNKKKVKLILMSATVNYTTFVEYFKDYNLNVINLEEICNKISMDFKSYKKDIFYLNNNATDYLIQSIRQVKNILKKTIKGDILVFLTGKEDIDIAYDKLIQYKNDKKYNENGNFLLFKLHSNIPSDQQSLIFKDYCERKVILSTNVAETSITIDKLSFVVDNGMCKIKSFGNNDNMEYNTQQDTESKNNYFFTEKLRISYISNSMAIQRAGRVGRTMDGTVYRIYSKEEYEKYIKYKEIKPEIQRMDISKVILMVVMLSIGNKKYLQEKYKKINKNEEYPMKNNLINIITEYKFIDQLESKYIKLALENLFLLDCLATEENNYKYDDKEQAKIYTQIHTYLTDIGRSIAVFPLNIEQSRTLIASLEYDCADEVIKIISILSVEKFYVSPNFSKEKDENYIKANSFFADKRGDHFKNLKVFNVLQNNNFNFKVIKNKFGKYINCHAIKEVKNIYEQLKDIINKKEYDKFRLNFKDENYISKINNTALYIRIKKSFVKGYISNISKLEGDCYYTKKRIESYIHPSSCLYRRIIPDKRNVIKPLFGNIILGKNTMDMRNESNRNKIILYNSLISTNKEYMRDCMVLDEEDIKES